MLGDGVDFPNSAPLLSLGLLTRGLSSPDAAVKWRWRNLSEGYYEE